MERSVTREQLWEEDFTSTPSLDTCSYYSPGLDTCSYYSPGLGTCSYYCTSSCFSPHTSTSTPTPTIVLAPASPPILLLLLLLLLLCQLLLLPPYFYFYSYSYYCASSCLSPHTAVHVTLVDQLSPGIIHLSKEGTCSNITYWSSPQLLLSSCSAPSSSPVPTQFLLSSCFFSSSSLCSNSSSFTFSYL